MTPADIAAGIFVDCKRAGLPVVRWAVWSRPFPKIGIQFDDGHELYLGFSPLASVDDLERFRDFAVMQFQEEWGRIQIAQEAEQVSGAPIH